MINEIIWQNAAQKIDDTIHKKVFPWLSFLPNKIDTLPRFERFQEHLMYVIMSFLQGENTTFVPQEMFIQIPLEEFANKRNNSNLQIKTFEITTGTIATCLLLSTIEKVVDRIKIPQGVTYKGENGNWYNVGDQFFANHPNEGIVLITCDQTSTGTKRLTYKRINDNAQRIKRPGEWNLFFNECNGIYRITPNVRQNLSEIDGQIKKLESLLPVASNVRQYHSAALVRIGSYPPLNENIPINSRYFDTIVQENSIERIRRDARTEVIVVVGDLRYKNLTSVFRRKAFKKIIYIGCEAPSESIATYPFTFREMYRYCAPSSQKYLEPQIEEIKFDWLEGTMRTFMEHLDSLSEEGLTEEMKKRLCGCLRSIFSDLEFCKDKWNSKKEDVSSRMSNAIDLDDAGYDIWEKIEQWVNEIEYDGDSNPKQDWVNRNKSHLQLVLGRYDRYKRGKVDDLREYDNKVVIDCATYYKNGDDNARNRAYQYILLHHLFAQTICLYYNGEEKYKNRLLWYLNKENDCYCHETRKRYGTAYDALDNLIEQTSFGLDDIKLDDYDETSLRGIWSNNNEVVVVTMLEGGEYIIDGEVLQVISDDEYRRIPITDLAEEDFGAEETSIWFYQNPDNFDDIITAFFDLPKEENVEHFSSLWKSQFQKYYNDRLAMGLTTRVVVREIEELTKIKRSVFKRYLDENCPNQFMKSIRHMRLICEFLKDQKYISPDEVEKIRKAQKLYFKRSKYGKILKDEVLSVKENKDVRLEMIPIILNNLHLTKEDLISNCLKYGVISKIDIKKKP